MIIITSFTCYGSIIGKVLIPGLGFGKPEGVVRDAREVLRKTRCLIRMGVGRVMAVMNRTLPVRQSPKFPKFSE